MENILFSDIFQFVTLADKRTICIILYYCYAGRRHNVVTMKRCAVLETNQLQNTRCPSSAGQSVYACLFPICVTKWTLKVKNN
jgi:hypothetical protein